MIFSYLDFKTAEDIESGHENQIPRHANVVRNFINVELFNKEDAMQEDCLGWITIMEKADEDLREVLKEERLEIEERKKVAEAIRKGLNYLDK